MPVVVNELVIRAVVDSTAGGNSGQPGGQGGGDTDREAIVAECVEQVLEILARKRER